VTHEENVSTEQSTTKADARVSGPDGDARRTQRAQAAAGERSSAAHGHDPAEAAGVIEAISSSFPKRAHLRRRSDFLRVQHDGRRQHTEDFVIIVTPAASSRVGVTVSTRVGNAVVRNRVKRLLREVLRRAWRAIEPPADVVVIAKPSAANATYAGVASQIERAFAPRGA
jgi:ribonuclease P protein component